MTYKCNKNFTDKSKRQWLLGEPCSEEEYHGMTHAHKKNFSEDKIDYDLPNDGEDEDAGDSFGIGDIFLNK